MESEILTWINFITELLENNYKIYIKGGNVIGLKVLELANQFIKDWDFYMVINDDKDYNQIKLISEKYNIHNEGQTLIILRKKHYVKIDNEALFELSIKYNERFSEFEIPLSTMKIELTKDNICYLESLINYFIKKDNDSNKLSNMMKQFPIYIYPADNGLFQIDNNSFDQGDISNDLLNIIKQVDDNINIQQFLISHIKQPDRLFIRLLQKNLLKSNKIKDILGIQDWLLNEMAIHNIINKFMILLSKKLNEIYSVYEDDIDKILEIINKQDNKNKIKSENNLIDLLQKYVNDIDLIFINVNIGRLLHKFNLLDQNGYQLINYLKPKFHNNKFLMKLLHRKLFRNHRIALLFIRIEQNSF